MVSSTENFAFLSSDSDDICQCNNHLQYVCLQCVQQSCISCRERHHSAHKVCATNKLQKVIRTFTSKSIDNIDNTLSEIEHKNKQTKELADIIGGDKNNKFIQLLSQLRTNCCNLRKNADVLHDQKQDQKEIQNLLNYKKVDQQIIDAICNANEFYLVQLHQNIRDYFNQTQKTQEITHIQLSPIHSVNQKLFNLYVDYVQKCIIPIQIKQEVRDQLSTTPIQKLKQEYEEKLEEFKQQSIINRILPTRQLIYTAYYQYDYFRLNKTLSKLFGLVVTVDQQSNQYILFDENGDTLQQKIYNFLPPNQYRQLYDYNGQILYQQCSTHIQENARFVSSNEARQTYEKDELRYFADDKLIDIKPQYGVLKPIICELQDIRFREPFEVDLGNRKLRFVMVDQRLTPSGRGNYDVRTKLCNIYLMLQ